MHNNKKSRFTFKLKSWGRPCSGIGSLPPNAQPCPMQLCYNISFGHRLTEFYCIYLNNQSDNCFFDEIAISKRCPGAEMMSLKTR